MTSVSKTITYYGVQPFESTAGGGSTVLAPIAAHSSGEAVRKAERLAREKGGAIAFSRTGDPTFGEFDEPVILGRFGDVPRDFEQ
jgi:hypothetical protein